MGGRNGEGEWGVDGSAVLDLLKFFFLGNWGGGLKFLFYFYCNSLRVERYVSDNDIILF